MKIHSLFSLLFRQNSQIRSVLHEIESMVIKWSHQIQDILEWNIAQPPFNQIYPDPQSELKFWKERKDNLLCIYDQVGSCYSNDSL